MKKIIFLLFTIFVIVFNALSQERSVKAKPKISTATIAQLNTATGWMLNKDEEWVSLKNTIPVSMLSEFSILLNYEKKGLGTDNFKYFKLKELIYNSNSYYILIKQYRDGFYNYPSIEEDWINQTSYFAYVFEKAELDKLANIEDGRINKIDINILDFTIIKWKSENEALNLIQTKLDLEKGAEATAKLVLHIAPYKDKNIVQFQIYNAYVYESTYSNSTYIRGIIEEYKVGNLLERDKQQVYYTDDLFKYCYYEVDYSTFNKFLKIDK